MKNISVVGFSPSHFCYLSQKLENVTHKEAEIFPTRKILLKKYHITRVSYRIPSELLLFSVKWQDKRRFWIWQLQGFNFNWLDSPKDFDAKDCEVHLKKRRCNGFSEKQILWFELHLSEWTFNKVIINKKFPDPGDLAWGTFLTELVLFSCTKLFVCGINLPIYVCEKLFNTLGEC